MVTAAVDAAGAVPVTVKVRKGIDDELSTFLDAGRIAEDAGAAAIALHARTAAQLYSGRRRLARHRPAQERRRHPGAGQRRHLAGR